MSPKDLDNLIASCLKLREEGKPVLELLNNHPEEKEEVLELLALVDWIEDEKAKIKPSRDLFTRVIKAIPVSKPETVTAPQAHRYVSEGHDGVRRPQESLVTSSNENIINNRMKIAFNMWFPVGALALVLILVGVSQFGGEQTAVLPGGNGQTELAAEPTGNIDDVLAFLDKEFEVENLILAEADSDSQFINNDSQAINDISNSYDENSI